MQRWLRVFLLPCLFVATVAMGQPLDASKARGQIGERPDGFVGLVAPAGASSADRDLVASINQQRRAHYARIAADQGTSVEVVAVLAGKKLVERTPVGQFYMSGGRWVKRGP